MKADPRTIYPGTNYYAGLTAPAVGANAGMGGNPTPPMTQTLPPLTGLTRPPVSGGLIAPPLASLFGQAQNPMGGQGSTTIR